MRFLVALLALTFPAFAQIRYSPTGFTAPFISTVTNQASAQAYLGISGGGGGQTNWPTLNGTNVWGGTNTFTADGFFPANRIAMRTLWASATNINVNCSVATAGNVTNQGNFVNTAPVAVIPMPPLLSTNSVVVMYSVGETLGSDVTAGNIAFYIGPSTNYLGANATFFSTSAARVYQNGTVVFGNADSFTNQFQGAFSGVQAIAGTSNFLNTSENWTLYVGLYTATSRSNCNFRSLKFVELVGN